ncbi:ribonuclease H-like domain-containing protein [Suillus subaureus]|uniref:Ribonuclease H-like domain-containing protein n=1 Tax=Suillus subaureus TaxID=48587 RepID=A0A9P7EFF5_9AGAM|nr:ribonuclease H-like domain-containing protein [Suillus subaureus]KAG1819562.1 ribonuclease H-like domain-containing protein [Suillus subaureus]
MVPHSSIAISGSGRDVKNPRRRIEVFERLQNHTDPKLFTPRCIFDGTVIMYSSRELPLSGRDSQTCKSKVFESELLINLYLSEKFDVNMSDKPRVDGSAPTRGVVQVTLKMVAADPIDFNGLQAFIDGKQTKQTAQVLTAINVLQLIIRQAPNLKYPNNTRAFFTKDAGIQSLGGGLELWRGYFQSVRPTIGKVLVNIDVSTAVMFKQDNFQNAALAVLRQNDVRALELRADSPQFRQLKSFFKGVSVTLVHRKGLKKIRGLVASAGNFQFENTTVKDYFKKAWGRQLLHPNIIGIQVGSKDRDEVIPAEMCLIAPDQRYTRKLPPEFSSTMVKFSSKNPQDRLALISAGISNSITADQRSALDYQNSPFLQDAGITVSPDPILVTGRVLPTPKIHYGNPATSRPVQPRNGSWNVIDQTFHEPKSLSSWGILNYARVSDQTINRFINTLLNSCKKLGMDLSPPSASQSCSGASSVVNDMRSLKHSVHNKIGKDLEMVLAILPTSSTDIYHAIKSFGDVIAGFPTQCVRENKIERANDQYCANLGMKINAKLGGVNSLPRSGALEKLMNAPFMVIGADVGHPAPGMVNQPSVASLVYSFDRYAARYEAMMSVQHPRQEKIDELRKLVYRAIDEFGERNRAAPVRIIFFRDGLSEGEYALTGKEEIEDIMGAIDDIWRDKNLKGGKPELTFIVVGKRHHVRFFPKNKNDGDRSGNCPAGFVADQGVGNPAVRDFYLQSHGGLLGTSRPSHYITLRDDIYKHNTDDLQELAFTLCHAYARATRSVSIPAPVYYADASIPYIVCARGAFHFNPAMGFDGATISSNDDAFDLERWRKNFKDKHANLSKKMNFM